MFVLDDKLKKYLRGYSVPKTDINEWIDKHKLSVDFNLHCYQCNNKLVPFLPFESREQVGFMWSICLCGIDNHPFTMAQRNLKEREEDKKFFNLLKGGL